MVQAALVPQWEPVPRFWAEVVVVLVDIGDLLHSVVVQLPVTYCEIFPELILVQRERRGSHPALDVPSQNNCSSRLVVSSGNGYNRGILQHGDFILRSKLTIAVPRYK
jgi:hypothetical protein